MTFLGVTFFKWTIAVPLKGTWGEYPLVALERESYFPITCTTYDTCHNKARTFMHCARSEARRAAYFSISP